jgi:hypothetical protein
VINQLVNWTILAVDPGAVSAAYAVLGPNGEGIAQAMPVANKMIDGKAFFRLLNLQRPTHAVVERVNAFPGQGVSSSFRFGMGYGIILGVLASHNVQIIDVAAGVWKRHFRLNADKEKARALAIKRFPDIDLGLKKDTGRAEALLMALWLKETRQ